MTEVAIYGATRSVCVGEDFVVVESGAGLEGHVLTRLSLFRTLLCTSTAQSKRYAAVPFVTGHLIDGTRILSE